MRQVAGTLRLDLAQFRELAAFAQFGSDLDKATLNQLNRGRRLVEVLKQPQYQPLAVEKQVVIIYAATNGYLDPVPVEQVRAYETELYKFLETRQGGPALRPRREEGDRRRDQGGNEPGAGGVREVLRVGSQGCVSEQEFRSQEKAFESIPPDILPSCKETVDAVTIRYPSPRSRGQVDAADHEGDEDGRRVETAAGAGAHPACASVRQHRCCAC